MKMLMMIIMHSVHSPPSPLSAGGGGWRVEPPAKFSKRGVLTGPHLLEGGCWEREGDFFLFSGGGGSCNFHTKKIKI